MADPCSHAVGSLGAAVRDRHQRRVNSARGESGQVGKANMCSEGSGTVTSVNSTQPRHCATAPCSPVCRPMAWQSRACRLKKRDHTSVASDLQASPATDSAPESCQSPAHSTALGTKGLAGAHAQRGEHRPLHYRHGAAPNSAHQSAPVAAERVGQGVDIASLGHAQQRLRLMPPKLSRGCSSNGVGRRREESRSVLPHHEEPPHDGALSWEQWEVLLMLLHSGDPCSIARALNPLLVLTSPQYAGPRLQQVPRLLRGLSSVAALSHAVSPNPTPVAPEADSISSDVHALPRATPEHFQAGGTASSEVNLSRAASGDKVQGPSASWPPCQGAASQQSASVAARVDGMQGTVHVDGRTSDALQPSRAGNGGCGVKEQEGGAAHEAAAACSIAAATALYQVAQVCPASVFCVQWPVQLGLPALGFKL
jgi:hypothetical protein